MSNELKLLNWFYNIYPLYVSKYDSWLGQMKKKKKSLLNFHGSRLTLFDKRNLFLSLLKCICTGEWLWIIPSVSWQLFTTLSLWKIKAPRFSMVIKMLILSFEFVIREWSKTYILIGFFITHPAHTHWDMSKCLQHILK